MKYDRSLDQFSQLPVPGQKEFPVSLWATQIPGGVIGQEYAVGPRVNLGLGKLYGNGHKLIEDPMRLIRVIDGGNQEIFNAEVMVRLCPAPEDLPTDSGCLTQPGLEQ